MSNYQSNMCHYQECKDQSLEDWYFCDKHFGREDSINE
jgi:hypothetical protein